MWLVPYYIKNLGIGVYALIPLALSLTQYIALFTMALCGGTSRFLTIDLHQENIVRANNTFNTAFWGLAGMSVVLSPFLVVFSWYAPFFFNVPFDQIADSRWLFAGVSIAFLVSTTFSTLNISTFAYNRLDLRNLILLSNILSCTFFTVFFFSVFTANLFFVSVSTVLGAVIATGASWYYWKKLTPDLSLSVSFFDKTRLQDLLTMGGWMIVNHVGTLLFLQIDLVVVNCFFGPVAGGEYATVLQWNTLIRAMSGVLAGVLGPTLMIQYAQNRYRELERLSTLSVRFLGLALAFPVGLACGFAQPLLSLWLGPDFAHLSLLMQIMLFHLVINLSVIPLFNINICYNKIRIPGIVTLLMGFFNLMLAIALSYEGTFGLYGVALAGGIVLSAKNALFTPWYAAKIQNVPIKTYFVAIIPGFLLSVVLGMSAFLLDLTIRCASWMSLISLSIILAAIFSFLTWSYILKPVEKGILLSMVPFREKTV